MSSIVMDASLPQFPISPLLRLPLEVRIQIYSQLVPNVPIVNLSFISGPTRNAATKHRDDAQPISPELLRINKQIYHEARPEFYGNARFQISVKNTANHYTFLGKKHSVWDQIPDTMRNVRKLQVTIILDGFGNPSAARPQMTQTYRLAALLHDLSRRQSMILEDVSLYVTFTTEFCVQQSRLPDPQDEQDEKIKAILKPLRLLTGLMQVEVAKQRGSGRARSGHSAEMKRLQAVLEEEVENVKSCMMVELPKGVRCGFCEQYLVGKVNCNQC